MSATAIVSSPAKEKDATGEIAVDLYPFIREYKGGNVERFLRSPFVPASEDAAGNRGVATKDVVIDKSTGVSARLFLASRAAAAAGDRLPVIVYIHGGSFCTESAFCRTYNHYAKSLAARTGALVVSMEYRLAPEHPIPATYDDAWAALQWVASLSDPWLADYADPERTFLAGDSAGGNIAYHTAVRASRDGRLMDIEGLVMVHPYFWGSERLASETVREDGVAMFPPDLVDRLWPFVTAGHAGNDDPRINPPAEEVASLTCRRMLVAVAEKDSMRDRGRQLAAHMRDCAWSGDAVTLVESEGGDHGFHLYNPLRATSKKLMESIVQFVNQRSVLPLPAAMLPELHELHGYGGNKTSEEGETDDCDHLTLSVPARPYIDIFGYGMAMKNWSGRKSMASGCLQIGLGRTSNTTYGPSLGGVRPNKTNRLSLPAAAPGSSIIKNFF
ncbi:probable carboxylesterase 2 [Lolium perenne]|uniref:probable carboxylesterase 2 n=1 Tax=Lolium perenne TaxID=4522 RepID=UPI0021F62A82|nr:probable carboxylesterase 2 [Lolium perenne]